MSTPRRRRALPYAVAGCLAAVAAGVAAGAAPALPSHPTDVAVALTTDRATYAPGDTIRYSLAVTNVGGPGVDQADIAAGGPGLPRMTVVDPGDGVLLSGETLLYAGERPITAADCGALSSTATVRLRAKGGKGSIDENPANDEVTIEVAVAGAACAPPPPDLSRPILVPPPAGPQEAMPEIETAALAACPAPLLRARVAGPGSLAAGETALFRVGVRNAGAARARRATLSVTLPSGFSLARPAAQASMADGRMKWSMGTMAPRSGRTVELLLRADRGTAGLRSLRARVSAACGGAKAQAQVRVGRARQAQVAPPVAG